MNIERCGWAKGENYIKYHDEEWGVPSHNERYLFEMLILEGFQAGLSWITILNRRENFRKAFDGFDYGKIAKYSEEKLESLMKDEGIIRNRLKIWTARKNAIAFMEVQKEFGSFDKYIWSFTGGEQVKGNWASISDVPATTELSDRVSKDLKKRGFGFVGSTIVYSYLQAIGVVDDHVKGCFKG